MSSPFKPLITIKSALIATGLSPSELNSLIINNTIQTSNRAGKITYFNNTSLEAYIANNGGKVEQCKKAVIKELLKIRDYEITQNAKILNQAKKMKIPSHHKEAYDKDVKSAKDKMNTVIENLVALPESEYEKLKQEPIGSFINIDTSRDIFSSFLIASIDFKNASHQQIEEWDKIIKKRKSNLEEYQTKIKYKLSFKTKRDVIRKCRVKYKITTNDLRAA